MSDKIELSFATPEGIFIYPHVIEPRAYQEQKNGKTVLGKPRFSTKFVLDEVPEELVAQAQAAGVAIFRDKHGVDLEPHEVPLPWTPGKKLIDLAKRKNKPLKQPLVDLYDGRFVFSASTGEDKAPEVLDHREKSLVPEIGDMTAEQYKAALSTAAKKVFSGSKGHLVARFNFMLDNKTAEPTTTLYLNAVLIVPGGVEIKGLSATGAKTSELLKKVRGRTSMADPTAGMDEEEEF